MSKFSDRSLPVFSGKFTVCFAPKFTDTNPYQSCLAYNLERLGVKLDGIEDCKLFLPKEVAKRRARILHLHWLHRFYHRSKSEVSICVFLKFFVGLMTLKVRNVPIVWTAHNIVSHEVSSVVLDRLSSILVARQAEAIITHSKAAKQELINTYKIKSCDKILVIPHANYIDQYKNEISKKDARSRLSIPEAKTVFLFFGLIRPYKGVPELIDAFEKLRADEICLLIAGQPRDNDLRGLIERKVAKNCESICFIPRFIAEDEVQIYMNAADVVVFPYRELLTSGAILLATSFGRACIAPQRGAILESLDSKGAFLYDPDSESGLLKAMTSALAHKANLHEMGQHNYRVAKAWGWEEVARETSAVYSKCLNVVNSQKDSVAYKK
ncbi:GDP-mannose:glycolipid 4-beta-D-mannosyltransferase [Acaryochloris thomasi RCC1774]|uniref:GDP-mannose:glycolipid 4-beta-D-mannosyltransferase n=1 Tax=Acaryochloris thomasi RCC1774 TaxID=1764569 RepID=A0A2W1JJU0_9CYAN|nr:glycosyltransferase [Acaryochloris thomasi]PZD71755.1 GDP-mannose:glycolipid 4-beta-D-mannosyltransferase [Acaryochloris thomasi RCC1774]